MSEDKVVESMIQEKGLTAPRITPTHIEDTVMKEVFYVFPETCMTICLLTLRNGFHVTGESACASPENFDEEIGRTIAYRNAKEKIWALEGYLLKEKLWQGEATSPVVA